MSSTLELINAISQGDAVATETAFNAAMAEKISARLDDMRINVAKSMFAPEEVQTQETTAETEGQAGTE